MLVYYFMRSKTRETCFDSMLCFRDWISNWSFLTLAQILLLCGVVKWHCTFYCSSFFISCGGSCNFISYLAFIGKPKLIWCMLLSPGLLLLFLDL